MIGQSVGQISGLPRSGSMAILTMVRVEPVEQPTQHTGPALALSRSLAGTTGERLVLISAESGIGQLVVSNGECPGAARAGDDGREHPEGSDDGGQLTQQH